MKKVIALFLCALLFAIPLYPVASAVSVESDIEHFEDGSYITVTYVRPPENTAPDIGNESWEDIDSVEESAPSGLTRLLLWIKDIFNKIFAVQSTVTKTKYCNYFSSDGELLWSVYLEGKFTYNHRKAVCVSSNTINTTGRSSRATRMGSVIFLPTKRLYSSIDRVLLSGK